MLLGIGIVLLVLLAAAVVYVVVGMPEGDLQIEGFLFDVEISPLHLFLIGVATTLIFAFALWLTVRGARRSRARQKEFHDLRRAAAERPAQRERREPAGSGVGVGAGHEERRRPRERPTGADEADRPVREERAETPPPRERPARRLGDEGTFGSPEQRRPAEDRDGPIRPGSGATGGNAPGRQAWPDQNPPPDRS